MQFVQHFTMLGSNFIVEGRGSGLLSWRGRKLGKESPMNGEQSRLLATGNRVCWDNSLTDRGTKRRLTGLLLIFWETIPRGGWVESAF